MKNPFFFAAATLVVLTLGSVLSHVAHAAPPSTPEVKNNKVTVTNLYVEPKGSCSWDFPALAGGGVNCSESATCTAVGARYGDACLAATNFGQDGGVYPPAYVNFSCRAVTDGIIFKACDPRSDGGTPGTTDLPDGGFIGRAIH